MDDEHSKGLPFSLDHVTSKIAYAYSKQEAFVFLGLAALGGSVGPLLAGVGDLPILAASGLAMALGAAILALAFTQRDLRRINRTSLTISLLMMLTAIGALAASVYGPFPRPSAQLEVSLLTLALTAGVSVVAYPLPLRRGDSVLFQPDEILDLANARALAMGALLLATFGVAGLAVPHATSSPGASVDPEWLLLGCLALGLAGIAAFVALPRRTSTLRFAAGIVGGGAVLSLAYALDSTGGLTGVEGALLPGVGLALLLALAFGLSPQLNRGRTVLGRRA
jgi:hypothetical protein